MGSFRSRFRLCIAYRRERTWARQEVLAWWAQYRLKTRSPEPIFFSHANPIVHYACVCKPTRTDINQISCCSFFEAFYWFSRMQNIVHTAELEPFGCCFFGYRLNRVPSGEIHWCARATTSHGRAWWNSVTRLIGNSLTLTDTPSCIQAIGRCCCSLIWISVCLRPTADRMGCASRSMRLPHKTISQRYSESISMPWTTNTP